MRRRDVFLRANVDDGGPDVETPSQQHRRVGLSSSSHDLGGGGGGGKPQILWSRSASMNGRDMRFMVQWASSSAATSADPRSLFHSSVPEHSTTTDRGSLSFSSRTPLVPALRRNRSSNAASSASLATGSPASAASPGTAGTVAGNSASGRPPNGAPLLSPSHSFPARPDDVRLPVPRTVEPSASAATVAPCPHSAPGWGMPCSACLRRALEGGGAVRRTASAEGLVQQSSGGVEEAGNGMRAPGGKGGEGRGARGEESELAGEREVAEIGSADVRKGMAAKWWATQK
ncbi:hypothetical protein CLOM_g6052 [Closterium sp. NIES-68]|nr:hypothetical protein CLOM_g6052 [Closterium sp. NIES-68]